MYKLFLCLRYLRKRRIAFFAVAAVCLCVAMVLIVVSVMDGFLQMVRDRSRGMLGDLIVHNRSLTGFPYYEDFIEEIETDMSDRIDEATPVIFTYGVLRYPRTQRTHMASFVGVKLEETYKVNDFKEGLFYEKYYPGTTSFKKQKQPCFGLNEQGEWVLPPAFEKAWQQWLDSAAQQERENAPIEEIAPYESPGYFARVTYKDMTEQGSTGPGMVGTPYQGTIIGIELCARKLPTGEYERAYYRGEEVTLTFAPFQATGKLNSLKDAFTKSYRYVDDNKTGVYEIDSTSVYLDFDELQKNVRLDSYNLADDYGGHAFPARTSQIQLKLKPGVDPVETRDLLEKKWEAFTARKINAWREETRKQIEQYEQNKSDNASQMEEDFWSSGLDVSNRVNQIVRRVEGPLNHVEIVTWEEHQAHIIIPVEKEKILVTILFGVISVVAVFLVGCIFYMIVQQKTQDIGIVKSVGATSYGVAQIFLSYGAAVGVVGGIFGTAIGTVFVWYINDLQDWLERLHPSLRVWSPEVYTFDRIPNRVDAETALVIFIVAILASMAGSLIAAYRAARIWPVEALRYE
jgi:lipoprotein-releasing system permease protein